VEKDSTFLKDEYFHLQSVIDKFDDKSLLIKQWCVTLCMTGISGAFVKKAPLLLLLSSGAGILFWIIEAYWKSFQRVARRRAKDIEAYLNGNLDDLKYPYITSAWGDNWFHRDVFEVFFWPHVLLPHLIVVLLGSILFTLNVAWKFIS